MSKVIVVDIDGVLANFNTHARAELIRFGAGMKPFEDGFNPDCWDYFQKYGASKEQEKAFWQWVTMYPEWWGKLSVHYDFGQSTTPFYDLHESGHFVYYVTSRPATAWAASQAWLRKSFDTTYPFTVVVTPRNKHLALCALTPDVIIEDRDKNLEDYRDHPEATKKTKLILVDRPYNRACKDVGILRVANTSDALREALK